MADRARLRQVERWLLQEFPFRGRVRVSVRKISNKEHGFCRRLDDGTWEIAIHPWSPVQIETLHHEWAHLGVKRMSHGPRWGRQYQEIVQRWHDRGGRDRSLGL